METKNLSTRDMGTIGERVAVEYLRRHGFMIRGTNIAKKTGEIDVLAESPNGLHFVEVKSLGCTHFPLPNSVDIYGPSQNFHEHKLRKVARTAEWIVSELGWNREWQIDAILVWIRRSDGVARVRYLPQVL